MGGVEAHRHRRVVNWNRKNCCGESWPWSLRRWNQDDHPALQWNESDERAVGEFGKVCGPELFERSARRWETPM